MVTIFKIPSLKPCRELRYLVLRTIVAITCVYLFLPFSSFEAEAATVDSLIKQAEKAARSGHKDEAVEIYNRALNINSGSCKAYRGLIHTTYETKRNELKPLLKGLVRKAAEEGNNDCLFYGIGLIFYLQGDYDNSSVYFHMASEKNPENVYALNGIGVTLLKRRNLEAAEKEFNLALKKDPSFYPALRNLLHLYNLSCEFDKAIYALRNFKGKSFSERYIRNLLLQHYSLKKGDLQGCLIWYLKGLKFALVLSGPLLIASLILIGLFVWTVKSGSQKKYPRGLGMLVAASIFMALYGLYCSGLKDTLTYVFSDSKSYGLKIIRELSAPLFIIIFIHLTLKKRQQSFAEMWGSTNGSIFKNFFMTISKIYPLILLSAVLMYFASDLINTYQPFEPKPVFSEILNTSAPALRLYKIFYVILLGPFFEEIIFRGLLYNIIKELYGIKAGMLLSAVLFGLYHINIRRIVFSFIIGFFLAGSYDKTGSLTTPFITHVFVNTTSLLLLFFISG